MNSGVSRWTVTGILVNAVVTRSPDTRIRTTLVDLGFAVLSVVPVFATALVPVGQRFTVSIQARAGVTRVDGFVAVDSRKACVALALVLVGVVDADTSQTRSRRALVIVYSAINAGVPGFTCTRPAVDEVVTVTVAARVRLTFVYV